MEGKAVSVIIGLILAGALLFMKFSDKGDTSAEYCEAMVSVYASAFADQSQADYVSWVVRNVHDDAFEDAYRMGGRRTAASMDDDAYAQALHKALCAELRNNNQEALIEPCEKVFQEFMAY